MRGFSTVHIAEIVLQLAIVLFSVVIHEVSHGAMAYKLGDPTAKNAGRLTLNPAKHLDPFGSVILPVILAFASGPVFAYAKPCPYNPAYFKHRKRDELLVAFAGPCSNLALGLGGGAVMWMAYSAGQGAPAQIYDIRFWIYWVGYNIAWINFILFFFNIIPIPPLDGSSIIGAVLPQRYMNLYYRVKQYSMFILLIVLFVLPMLLNWDPLGQYLSYTAGSLVDLLSPGLSYYVSSAGL